MHVYREAGEPEGLVLDRVTRPLRLNITPILDSPKKYKKHNSVLKALTSSSCGRLLMRVATHCGTVTKVLIPNMTILRQFLGALFMIVLAQISIDIFRILCLFSNDFSYMFLFSLCGSVGTRVFGSF